MSDCSRGLIYFMAFFISLKLVKTEIVWWDDEACIIQIIVLM